MWLRVRRHKQHFFFAAVVLSPSSTMEDGKIHTLNSSTALSISWWLSSHYCVTNSKSFNIKQALKKFRFKLLMFDLGLRRRRRRIHWLGSSALRRVALWADLSSCLLPFASLFFPPFYCHKEFNGKISLLNLLRASEFKSRWIIVKRKHSLSSLQKFPLVGPERCWDSENFRESEGLASPCEYIPQP